MISPLFIHWNPNPELFNLFGAVPIRYYSLLWIVGLICSFLSVRRQYRDKQISDDKFEPLFFYCFFGILIGSRLGHCLFYQPDYYLHHLSEIILPVKFLPGGGWKWTGYEGLASHGGTLGLIIALWFYCHSKKMHYMDVLDMIAVGTPFCACCIRLANLMNSEIIGKATQVPWAFIFERVDMVPRHPAQLYEAIAYFIFGIVTIILYRRGLKIRQKERIDLKRLPARVSLLSFPYTRGFFFGLCLIEIFLFRFFIEFLKENQVDFEANMSLDMGQWLSVPFVLLGVYCMFFYGRKHK